MIPALLNVFLRLRIPRSSHEKLFVGYDRPRRLFGGYGHPYFQYTGHIIRELQTAASHIRILPHRDRSVFEYHVQCGPPQQASEDG